MPEITSQSHVHDNLEAGGADTKLKAVTVVSGQNLPRGALVGEITANGKVALSLTAADDGSQVPTMIMAQAVDASGGDAVGSAYVFGEFNEDAVTYGTGHTAASVEPGLRARGIFLRSTVDA